MFTVFNEMCFFNLFYFLQNLDVKWLTFAAETVDTTIIMDHITNRLTRITIERSLQMQQIIIIMRRVAKTAKVIAVPARAAAAVPIQTVQVIRIRRTEVKVHK